MKISNLTQKITLLSRNYNIEYGNTECVKFVPIIKARAYMNQICGNEYYVCIRNINLKQSVSAIQYKDLLLEIILAKTSADLRFLQYTTRLQK
jgi:hypothetical protein